MRGKLIVIEGTDCSGKETQTRLLVDRLNREGIRAERLAYPDYDTPTGKIIGACYLGKEYLCKSELKSESSFIFMPPKAFVFICIFQGFSKSLHL